MKTLTNLGRLAFLLIICTLLFNTSSAQNKKLSKKEKRLQELKSMIDLKNFQFVASSMHSFNGAGRNLDQGYGIKFTPDSLMSQLPFAGSAQMQLSLDNSKNELEFTSKNFEYSMLSGQTGGWQITIVPKDNPKIVQMVLTVDDEGEATLIVKNTLRDPVTFSGSVEANGK